VARPNQPQHPQQPQIRPAAQLAQVQTTMEVHGGPLPDPEILAKYEQVMPGAAERIFKMAETEQHERHLMVYRDHRIKSVATLLGQVLAFVMGMSGIIGGVYLVAKDKSLAGFSVFITSLTALCGVYLYNRQDQKRSKQENSSEP
jgi:uncharacterized membrane protein